jgi:hypothetical protein
VSATSDAGRDWISATSVEGLDKDMSLARHMHMDCRCLLLCHSAAAAGCGAGAAAVARLPAANVGWCTEGMAQGRMETRGAEPVPPQCLMPAIAVVGC